jgi:photosystem II stability/assembly factor-like uncharacterized protein
MKKMYFLLIGFIIFNTLNAQNWTNQTSGTSMELDGVFFPTATIGYAVGVAATIVKTTNGGETWTALNPGIIPYTLASVCFLDENIGYVVGENGAILKTTDGGTNWTVQNSGVYFWLNSVFFINANTGFAVGENGAILKTIDGGMNWSLKNSGTSNYLMSVCFPDENTGYAVGSTLCKTTDGGETWTNLNTSGFHSFFFIDANIGYLIGGAGSIVKTTNGGIDWVSQISGTTYNLNSVFFSDPNTGYIVGDEGIILKTTNGGFNWTIQTDPTSQWLGSVYFTDANIGYTIGANGTILKTGTSLSGLEENSISSGILKIYPNPTNGKFNVETSMQLRNGSLSIININGQILREMPITGYKTLIDISDMPLGTYFVKVSNENKVEVGKIFRN